MFETVISKTQQQRLNFMTKTEQNISQVLDTYAIQLF